MAWLTVTLIVNAKHADALCDALIECGAGSVDTTDAAAGTERERAVYAEPGVEPDAAWNEVRITALFDENSDAQALVAAAQSAAGVMPPANHTIARIADQDWVRATQSQFAPVRICERLWVVPSWHTAPDPAAVNLVIDPGLAFGTGTHATTRLCLAWLARHLRGGETVLDYGCGSGILAIAALKLGAARATGIDIDPGALLAARRNALQNQVTATFEAPDHAIAEAADVVVANILSSPLQLLAPLLARATREAGSIVLSGILEHQADEVSAVYSEWFEMRRAEHDEGWVLLAGTRRPAGAA